ncbi:hypothetical protein A3Q56_02581 [Intoshia linei]|uniref:Uncharacterized protein n=1 Tax=Intoshia linei TaxID=1819745 RepID=A0A177B5W4_9BILA|nr:hypothetical protein A3Q56_02581 [Intoshia linei]
MDDKDMEKKEPVLTASPEYTEKKVQISDINENEEFGIEDKVKVENDTLKKRTKFPINFNVIIKERHKNRKTIFKGVTGISVFLCPLTIMLSLYFLYKYVKYLNQENLLKAFKDLGMKKCHLLQMYEGDIVEVKLLIFNHFC